MINQEFRYVSLPNLGYILYKLDPRDLRPINEAVNKVQSDFTQAIPGNKDLAGNIVHEYDLPDECTSYIEQLLHPLAIAYLKQSTSTYLNTQNETDRFNLKLRSTWVNFQQKHEFNPPHTHGGVLSFVIWLKVPFIAANELNRTDRIPKDRNYAGCFEFQYTNTLGGISNIVLPVDKSWEGNMALFPSKMHHAVYPFYTSDDYRVTISGNFHHVNEGEVV